MKLKATKKEIKDKAWKLYSIGYCDAQYLFNYSNPFAYSSGNYGWSCDYYDFNGVIISTGYSTIGDRVDRELLQRYETQAMAIVHSNSAYEDARQQLTALIDSFITEVTK